VRPGRRQPDWIVSRLMQVGFLALVLLAWYLMSHQLGVNRLLLPQPESVWAQFVAILKSGDYIADLSVTLYELAVAFTCSALAGTLSGYFISRSRYRIEVLEPLMAGLYAIPAILLFPLYVLFFGIGPGSKIAIGMTVSFFPVVLNTIAGLRGVEPLLVTAARSMGATPLQLFLQVLLPGALPMILTGLRMGFIVAFLSILGTESIMSFSGLGHRIVSLAESMDNAAMFAYILFAVIISAGLNAVVFFVESRARR
jgi:ABC-type nitrate/sulfonate/bicarbonate transport system permease component